MSSNAQQFAKQVLAAFKDAGRFTDEEVGDAGGPSTTKMTQLRKVADGVEDMPPPRGDTLRKIDAAANWEEGSARRLWHDGSPPQRLSVGPSTEDSGTLLFRRPDGLTDEQWEQLQSSQREHWEWLIDRATRER